MRSWSLKISGPAIGVSHEGFVSNYLGDNYIDRYLHVGIREQIGDNSCGRVERMQLAPGRAS